MARKTLRQIYAQAERLSEANWRRKNTWETSALSRKAKQSRDRLIARAESRAVQQHGYGAVAG
ncbi:hypothetical protein [Prevotella pallens]|jgi:hypothetical protein|uniref:hypothetical protein n=1 Tax=Prevotella pallens TaxID=60133 RepID=UPI002058AFE4|nr:hypothetical protein [Prevotella pallens]DAF21861.1 MAG TPA: hypothetical protein [Caudoviricetes sp.]DAU91320.1 MAG TPA: hypothetical protein [Bacteriophage sp.]DAK41302.1 MAG TPA: hypothetical protein [Caudoviricetes sp.]DAN46092.1 MAG TPA: hypothetical protein [Caudoviricetes sp.]DAV62358.1 MAG TPA: hypothetical protein [Caudoviricetes sp.]